MFGNRVFLIPLLLVAAVWGAQWVDRDGDGYSERQGDCNDSNYRVNLKATEVCDYVDNDCDGEVDEDTAAGAKTWYQDLDQDGYGGRDPIRSRPGCWAEPGWADNYLDCNDTDARVHPKAKEIWYDGIDSNCDGRDDFDQDGDGYRSDKYGGDDCNDQARTVHPCAPEFIDAYPDNNCDGEMHFVELPNLGRGPECETPFSEE